MTVRTVVSTNVPNDRADEVVRALQNLDANAIVGIVNRSHAPDARSGLSVSLTGDVREAVKEQLKVFPDLECEIDLQDVEDL
ncbi:hypothetical protein [Streptomyces sp. IBSBF 2806]|uniref:hypothetical protein n=1 Tax=Streptomyces sp. IBSBF 2806 TaxID=2903529 RepID=UPI002FDBD88C